VLVGTVNYMAPEQIVGATPDHRADIFAVGAVFYELLSFQKAFPGSIADGLFMRICHEPPPSLEVLCPGLDAGVVSVVTRALEKDANARYQDLAVMARDIAAVRMRLESAGQLEETVVTIAPGDLPAVSAATITPAGTPRPFPTGSATPQLTDPNLQRILGELEQARERTDRLRTALQNAREALGQGFFDAAIKAGEEALALDPTVGEARDIVQQAKSAVAERQRHAATEAARRVIEAARAALESGDETGARELLDAVKAPTEALEAAVAELREKIGDTERRRQRRAGIFIDAAELAIGQLDFARAASLLDDAARVDASLPAIATLRSQVDAALTAAREAETARTTAAAAMKEADAAFARGDFAAARAHATRALTADPQLWAASAMLSRVQQAERLAEQRARQQELALAEAARRRARLSAAIAIVVAIGVTVVAFLLTR
jgi:tetratricopeptide (TPR) repeat protein